MAVGPQIEFGSLEAGQIRHLLASSGVMGHLLAGLTKVAFGKAIVNPLADYKAAWDNGVLKSFNEATAWGIALAMDGIYEKSTVNVFYNIPSKTFVVIATRGMGMEVPGVSGSAGGFVKVAGMMCPETWSASADNQTKWESDEGPQEN